MAPYLLDDKGSEFVALKLLFDMDNEDDSSCNMFKESLSFILSSGLIKFCLNAVSNVSLLVIKVDSAVEALERDKLIAVFSLFATFISTAICLKELLWSFSSCFIICFASCESNFTDDIFGGIGDGTFCALSFSTISAARRNRQYVYDSAC